MNSSFKIVLLIFISSGLGGVARYQMQLGIYKLYPHAFPWGTFLVNILGCLLIGIFFALSEKGNLLSHEWRLALTTGFCGGFTTFSAFAYENINLLKSGNYLYAGLYITASAVLGIAAVFLGIYMIKSF